MERKSVEFEVKDFSKEKRSAVIAHAVYGNIDLTGDISCKGMFSSSWSRKDPIEFRFNHDAALLPGIVLRTFEDENKAYTEVKFGKWTLGDDMIEMIDAGVIRGASFGYKTEKKDFITKDNKRVRKLLQVKHIETSLLTEMPANPLAGVVELRKSFESKQLTQNEADMLGAINNADIVVMERLINAIQGQDANSDIYIWIMDQISRRSSYLADVRWQLYYNTGLRKSIKSHVEVLEKFCRETKATDDCIFKVQLQLDETKQLLSSIDTDSTLLIKDGESSREGNEGFINKLLLLNQRLSVA
jgi:HK97 family phage prohead protease